jgi:ABC1 atypical kinase-like domain
MSRERGSFRLRARTLSRAALWWWSTCASAVLAVAVLLASRRGKTQITPIRRRTRGSRNLQLASLGARVGGAFVIHRARRIFTQAGRRPQLDATYQFRSAEEIAKTLGNMKGAMMKLGQMAGYLGGGLPEPARQTLATLQSNAAPMAADLAEAVLEQELGQRPERLFRSWDPHPIASASIGQVHRAISREGVAIAVKIQYPGVRSAIHADLGNVRLLFNAARAVFPALDPGPLATELRARVAEELDYEQEAANQRTFARHYRGHPFIHVPDVVEAYCTPRVLTTELDDGSPFDAVETWTERERNLAAETIFRFVFHSLYKLHAFNGDPHPGNYLFHPGGRVTFLDFGLVKYFGEDEIGGFMEIVRTLVLQPDAAEFRAVAEGQGLLCRGAPVSDQEVADYFAQLYDFVLTDEVRALRPDFATHVARGLFDPRGRHAAVMRFVDVPPPFVVVQRLNLGLYAVLGRLRATANWRRIAEEIWPMTVRCPTTDLGRVHAAWLTRSADS